jgi:hypothetical protein
MTYLVSFHILAWIYPNQQLPGDLGTRKRPGTSCKIEIHFWFKIIQSLINGIRFLSQTCPSYSFPCARHRHKVSQPRSQGFSLFVIGKAGKGPGTGRSHDFQHPDIVGVINYNN